MNKRVQMSDRGKVKYIFENKVNSKILDKLVQNDIDYSTLYGMIRIYTGEMIEPNFLKIMSQQAVEGDAGDFQSVLIDFAEDGELFLLYKDVNPNKYFIYMRNYDESELEYEFLNFVNKYGIKMHKVNSEEEVDEIFEFGDPYLS